MQSISRGDVRAVAERDLQPRGFSNGRLIDFDGLSEAELMDIFDWEGDQGRVKPGLRDGITWLVGDAGDPELPASVGGHELVVANNFLCHMDARSAERCRAIWCGL